MNHPPELPALSATEQLRLLRQRSISCVELLSATLHWIDRINPVVNAICTLDADRAMDLAQSADHALARQPRNQPGARRRALFGLPIAIKDLAETRGLRTTFGSPLFAEHVPDINAAHVDRLQSAGAIIIGKTNVPEFGAGSQTFNSIFGTTVTPFDPERTSGGSSGGAAAALASRMLSLADGSDLGGSLRNPAAFCNVIGLRPTAGLVPLWPTRDAYSPLPVAGPMARSVADLALLLEAMAGTDARVPLSRMRQSGPPSRRPVSAGAGEPELRGIDLTRGDLSGLRFAFTEDLGFLPVEPSVTAVLASVPEIFESLDAQVGRDYPDLRDAEQVFERLRAQLFVAGFGSIYRRDPGALKASIRWNIEQGLAATAEDLAVAQTGLTRIYERMQRFFTEYDFLLMPTTQLLPFDAGIEWPTEVAGRVMPHYLGWMASCTVISVTGCPAISMPGGFSTATAATPALPVGLQIVGPPGSDWRLLEVAAAFESVTRYAQRNPDWSRLSAAAPATVCSIESDRVTGPGTSGGSG